MAFADLTLEERGEYLTIRFHKELSKSYVPYDMGEPIPFKKLVQDVNYIDEEDKNGISFKLVWQGVLLSTVELYAKETRPTMYADVLAASNGLRFRHFSKRYKELNKDLMDDTAVRIRYAKCFQLPKEDK